MLHAPQRINASHDLSDFDCGEASLNDWLIDHARQADSSGSARTFVVLDSGTNSVAGYFSLTVGQIDVVDAPARVAMGMG